MIIVFYQFLIVLWIATKDYPQVSTYYRFSIALQVVIDMSLAKFECS